MPGGRPSDFCEAVAERICDAIADGETLTKACKADDLPAPRTVFKWLDKHPEFAHMYARARSIRAERRFEQLQDLCDRIESGDVEPHAGRVLVDALKWQMSKENPRVYGDKTVISGDADAPLQIAQAVHPDELAKRVAFLLANATKPDAENLPGT